MDKPFLGLRTCIYKVPQLEEAKHWYTLAFQSSPYFDEPFYVGFDIGGFELGLLPADEETITTGQNIQVYWGVEDIEKEYARLIDLGGRIHELPHNVGGELMVATLYDPWDNLIGMIYNPVFGMKSI